MARPGVMIYFDTAPMFQKLNDMQAGQMIKAVMEYAEYDVIPQFDDAVLDVLFSVMQPKLDADAERYEQRCQKATDSINTRWNKSKADADANADNDTNVYERIPTNTNHTNYNSTTTTKTTTTTKQSKSTQQKKERRKEKEKKESGTALSPEEQEFQDRKRYNFSFFGCDKYECGDELAELITRWEFSLYTVYGEDDNSFVCEQMQNVDRFLRCNYSADDVCSMLDDAINRNLKELDTKKVDLKLARKKVIDEMRNL